jgi:hypothetical protein
MPEPITITNLSVTGRAQARDPNLENVSASYDANFSGPASYRFDLTTINQQKVFGIPRTLFVDNGSNPKQISVSVSNTQQNFIVPAYASGYFTLNASQASRIDIVSDGGATDLVTLTIFNYELSPVVWYSFGTFNLDKPFSVYGTMAEGDNIALATNNKAVYIAGKSPTGTLLPLAVDATGKQYSIASITDGGDASQGAKADAANTDPTTAGSVIAFLKGLLSYIKPGTNIANGQVSISVSALLVAARTARRTVTINNGALDVYIGTTPVTTANGLLVKANSSITLKTTAAVYAISSGVATPVSFLEVF